MYLYHSLGQVSNFQGEDPFGTAGTLFEQTGIPLMQFMTPGQQSPCLMLGCSMPNVNAFGVLKYSVRYSYIKLCFGTLGTSFEQP